MFQETDRTIIIAEAGVNHNGDFDMACRMIDAAAAAGADYVKFQTAVPELVIAANAPKAEYQKETTGSDERQLEMCRAIHLPLSAYAKLNMMCRERRIGFVSTPFDHVSIDCLEPLRMDFWKIPSGEITNLPYLRKIGALGQPVVMSTGMATAAEVDAALKVLRKAGTPLSRIALLHCTTQYPAPDSSVNLRAMHTLAATGCAAVGYSDHTVGITASVAAVACGARIIEKHFTLDRNLPGPDHKASIEPAELAEMVAQIRRVELMLGDGCKTAAEAEIPNIAIARKSIVAAMPIAQGETFTSSNIIAKRPGTGISPMLWDSLSGRKATRAYSADELIDPSELGN